MKESLDKYVDKEGSVLLNGLRINVRCIDYKESYGKPRWLVVPLSGMGQAWIEQDPLLPILDTDR